MEKDELEKKREFNQLANQLMEGLFQSGRGSELASIKVDEAKSVALAALYPKTFYRGLELLETRSVYEIQYQNAIFFVVKDSPKTSSGGECHYRIEKDGYFCSCPTFIELLDQSSSKLCEHVLAWKLHDRNKEFFANYSESLIRVEKLDKMEDYLKWCQLCFL
ncbi:BA75_04144T0 [Komagataella pastoris]|uniref:BA75_04144T0 n=1 Tax=Komagataella pastoris TaxID=4922 RepID=A0A1B2JF15_PICPA|nr:BA75_04144T0 [Komagataella pastoris]